MKRQLLCATLLLPALGMVGADALAGGFAVARFGGEHGHSTTDNATAMYYNPAGLAFSSGTRLYIDIAAAYRTLTYNRPEGTIDNITADATSGSGTPAGDGVAANTGEGKLSNFIVSPMMAVTTDFGVEGLGVGIGFYTPFGGSSTWDKVQSSDLYPGAEDGPQRWAVIEGSIKTSYITLAGAYKIKPARLSFGAGLNLNLHSMDTIRARNSSGYDSLVTGKTVDRDDGSTVPNVQEGRALLQVSGTSISISAGLMWEPIDGLYVGASYQGQPGFGEIKLEGEATLVLGGATIDSTNPTKAELFHTLPDIFRGGVRYRVPKSWEIRTDFNYTRWSVFTDQCIYKADVNAPGCSRTQTDGKILVIPRDWEDTFGFKLGGSYWVSPDVELVLGGGWDGNAVPDKTIDPSLFDVEKWTASIGATIGFMEDRLVMDFLFTSVFYGSRDVAARNREDIGGGATQTNIAELGYDEIVRNPDMGGKYDSWVGLLTINANYKF